MSIFKHTEISTYLRDYLKSLPKKGYGESSRIAKALGVSSTLISQVIAGQKFLTPEQAQDLASHLGLLPLEADYLTFMVHKERAGTKKLEKYWTTKLNQLRDQSLNIKNRVEVDKELSDQERGIFYSSPIYTAIALFSSLGDKGKSITEICERFEISRARASELLKFLTDIGVCVEKNGHYHLGTQKTHLEWGSPHLLKHLSNWRSRAIVYSENLHESELMYSAPVSLSRKDFDFLREEMAGFIKKFLNTVHASPAEEMACFNMDFFFIRK
jgi:uncharacterized protein (TIGR02147 family)